MRHFSLGIFFALLVDHAACQGQNLTELPPGKKLLSIDGSSLSMAHWSQDGKTLVTLKYRNALDDERFKTVEVWDALTGKMLHTLGELETRYYPFLHLSADGSRLVVSQDSFLATGEIEVWNARRLNLDQRITVKRRRRPQECIAVSAKGDLIADVYYEKGNFKEAGAKGSGGIDIHDAASGKMVQTLRQEKVLPRIAAFTADGQSIITRSSDDVIRLWNIKTGKVVRQAQASLKSAGELAISPDGKRLVIPTAEHEALQIWSVPELKALSKIPIPFYEVTRVQFSPSGKRLLVAGFREDWIEAFRNKRFAERSVLVWDVENNKMLHHWNTTTFNCGFYGEDHLCIGHYDAIMRYPLSKK